MKSFLYPLSAKEEEKALHGLKQGDRESRDMLIERNMRLVAHVAKKYAAADEDMEDMISIGTIGLIKAVMTYDENRGSRLATYAARCIDNELLMHLRTRKKISREISLYEPIGTDKEGNQINLFDIMEAEEKDVVEDMEKRKHMALVRKLVTSALSDREKEIITLRYGLKDGCPVTQREIAAKIGISRSYVSRIEKKALEKLKRQFLSADGERECS